MGLRVAFDASALAKRERTGIARYGVCLIDALSRLAEVERLVLGYRWSRWRRRRHAYRGPPRAAMRFFTDRGLRWSLGPHDVFHGLDARIPTRSRAPTVATLHDVSQLEQMEIASEAFRDRKWRHLRLVADRADRIICVSQATRAAFSRVFDLGDDDRLRVVHHGLEPRFGPVPASQIASLRSRLQLPERYVLFVGLISARKNCRTLVEAFDAAARRLDGDPPPVHLVLAGGRGHGSDEALRAIERSPFRGRFHLPGYVDDADLPALYAGARAFLFPGRAEGFGMPMLEAMACRTPVVADDNPVSKEVAGDAALLTDAGDPDALATAIARVVHDDEMVAELVERGKRRAAGFTWDQAARKTLAVYHEVTHVGRATEDRTHEDVSRDPGA